MKFQDWVAIREEQAAVQAQTAVPAGLKDDKSRFNIRVKQVMAGNLTKPKPARKKALENLGKQAALDPSTTPKDLESIADLINPPANKNPMVK